MLTLSTPSGFTALVYDDVRAIPASRYQRFSAKYLEYSMGTNIFAAESHLSRMALFLGQNNTEAVKLEFNQLVRSFSAVQEEASGPAIVLSSLVASIDGRPCSDLTDTGLMETARLLLEAGATQGQILDTLEEAKKHLSATS
ncbi:hypothetical protein DNI29_04470 [Hymenobacter sediminis]|uniref:hypothetical protein n=1 Tax=Hymenobacter sediminis TaxID=2218621 RepID=UPI000DA69470|nr:hypothetical protein [Hymenobacter sediminis]RPD50057.1 hypothetical protein DNI29_04470 [Hymenobacter sediminis]